MKVTRHTRIVRSSFTLSLSIDIVSGHGPVQRIVLPNDSDDLAQIRLRCAVELRIMAHNHPANIVRSRLLQSVLRRVRISGRIEQKNRELWRPSTREVKRYIARDQQNAIAWQNLRVRHLH